MIIKVCGMREPDNIKAVDTLGIDLMGFIFVPQSPRYVSMVSSMAGIIPDYAADRQPTATAQEPSGDDEARQRHTAARVGVFVDDMPQNIVTRIYNYHLDYVQLHGSESPTMIRNLKRTVMPDIAPELKIIKAIAVTTPDDLKQSEAYEDEVDLLLFDTKLKRNGGTTSGGSGRKFDWTLLDHYHGHTPFLLSGGIGPDDAEAILAIRHPQFAGIDLNSRFETAPGVKDVEKLRSFITKIRQHEQDK